MRIPPLLTDDDRQRMRDNHEREKHEYDNSPDEIKVKAYEIFIASLHGGKYLDLGDCVRYAKRFV